MNGDGLRTMLQLTDVTQAELAAQIQQSRGWVAHRCRRRTELTPFEARNCRRCVREILHERLRGARYALDAFTKAYPE